MQDYIIRERAVRIQVDAATTRPPGRGKTWTAEAGRWRAEGATEKAAIDGLVAGLREFLTQYQTPKVLTFRGHVAVISPDLGDVDTPLLWNQQIIGPDGRVSSSQGVAEGWDEAAAHARHTLAHISTDWHDDPSVQDAADYLEGGQRFGYGQYGPGEFYRYAAWQRAAKAAGDAGRGDWHEWASEHEAEFAVPRRAQRRIAA